MASSGKRKTTMAKLNREAKLRDKRHEKQMRKNARKRAAAEHVEAGGAPGEIWSEQAEAGGSAGEAPAGEGVSASAGPELQRPAGP